MSGACAARRDEAEAATRPVAKTADVRRMVVAARVRQALKAAGFTRCELASRIGKTPSLVGHVVSGHLKAPETRAAIARELGVAVRDLWPLFVSVEPGRIFDGLDEPNRMLLAMELAGLSYEDLAERTGLSAVHLRHVAYGRVGASLAARQAIARACGRSFMDLWGVA